MCVTLVADNDKRGGERGEEPTNGDDEKKTK